MGNVKIFLSGIVSGLRIWTLVKAKRKQKELIFNFKHLNSLIVKNIKFIPDTIQNTSARISHRFPKTSINYRVEAEA